MILRFLLITISLLAFSCQNSSITKRIVVNSLKEKDVIDSLKSINYEIDEKRSIKYHYGYFTSLNNKECLVEFPMIKKDFRKLSLFLFENIENKWFYSGLSYIDTQENKIVDYNKDGIYEVLITYVVDLSHGYGDKIIGFQNKQINVLYENYSNWEKSLTNNLIKGDTITTTIEIKLIDVDSDSIDEIVEKKTIGLYKETTGNMIEQDFIENETIIEINN